MNKKNLILKILNKTVKTPKIPLFYTNDFTLLIAIMLSGNSTDKTVNKVTPTLFKKANTPKKMVKIPIKELKKIIKPCGMYNIKAKFILQLSDILIKKYKSKIPGNFKELEALPGIGHKTASVFLAYVFKKDTFPVDTHVKRCARRWGITKEKNVLKIERDLKKFFPKKFWNKLHLQLIYFGKKFCRARGHSVEKCPMCSALKKFFP
jgi:endonuclease-3